MFFELLVPTFVQDYDYKNKWIQYANPAPRGTLSTGMKG
jgi:hypothetical protein